MSQDLRVLVSPSGQRRCEVDLALGGHVVKFSLDGRNALAVGSAEVGSTLWPSPQSLWQWPPPAQLDKGAYRELPAESESALAIESEVCAATGLQFQKRFWFVGERLELGYCVINRASAAQRVAPWEVTRLPGGLSFYPGRAAPLQVSVPEGQAAEPMVARSRGIIWHAYAPAEQTSHYKLFGDGGPWLANFNDGLLFLKRFPQVPPAMLAPDQAAVEIYAHGDVARPYIELEQQGPWLELQPGEANTWQVCWWLAGVSPDLTQNELGAAASALVGQ